ncbi:MAG: hypothetical protein HeimC2_12620 [Candidatus Heimdallarchaeota archaeon LC_2]|nr:MAG: hypothetical protein HeimC2_12620 [Candidatus Heimdallarchaeota archaeon LC_2]
MNDPIELLKIEHQNIIRGLNLLTTTGKIFEDGTTPTNEINELIKFFRLYADDAHHAKEEAILFPRFILKNPSFSSETSPISVLIDHHFLGRKIVANISKLDNQFPFHVNDYNELLQRHIEIEDELFPQLAEENFDAKEINDIAEEFSKADEIRNLDELLKILDRVEINIM